jgi:hypothetical protein
MAVTPYGHDVEEQMRTLFVSLNERDRRRYAAIEASKLGRGGQTYVRSVLGCDYKTLRQGMQELNDLPDLPRGRVRKKGGP